MLKLFKLSTPFNIEEKIILRDHLALERTRLANERTFLSYIRTSLYFVVGGIALIQIQDLSKVRMLGYVSLFVAVLLLFTGVVRFIRLSRRLRDYYNAESSPVGDPVGDPTE